MNNTSMTTRDMDELDDLTTGETDEVDEGPTIPLGHDPYTDDDMDEQIPMGIGPYRHLGSTSEGNAEALPDGGHEPASGGIDTTIQTHMYGESSHGQRKRYTLGERKVNTRVMNKKAAKHLDMANVITMLGAGCCRKKRCLTCFEKGEVMRVRQMFWKMKQPEQVNYLIDETQRMSIYTESGNIQTIRWPFLSKSVCAIAFGKLYGLGNQRVADVAYRVRHGIGRYVHGHVKNVRTLTVSSQEILSWMRKYFSMNTEIMPNSDRFHLADSLTRRAVYELFLLRNRHLYNRVAGIKEPSCWRFYAIWRKECPKICIPSVKRFSVCAQCSFFKASRDRATNRMDRGKCKFSLLSTTRLGIFFVLFNRISKFSHSCYSLWVLIPSSPPC
jgi:hypothetical protein